VDDAGGRARTRVDRELDAAPDFFLVAWLAGPLRGDLELDLRLAGQQDLAQ